MNRHNAMQYNALVLRCQTSVRGGMAMKKITSLRHKVVGWQSIVRQFLARKRLKIAET